MVDIGQVGEVPELTKIAQACNEIEEITAARWCLVNHTRAEAMDAWREERDELRSVEFTSWCFAKE